MTLKTNVIDSAVKGKFTEFSDSIKAELHNKMSNHEDTAAYAAAYDKIQEMKKAFAKIGSDSEE